MSEPLFAALLMAALWLLSRRPFPRIGEFTLSAVAMGCAALTRPVACLFAAAVALLKWEARTTIAVRRRLLYVMVSALVFSPWVARNYIHFRTFVPGTNGGWALYLTTYRLEHDDYVTPWHPPLTEARWQARAQMQARGFRYTDLNEAERDQLLKHMAVEKIRAYPLRYARLVLENLLRVWFAVYRFGFRSWRNAAVCALNASILALAALGLWRCLRAPGVRDPRWVLIPVIFALNTVLYSLFYGIVRYNNPMIPMLLLPAAHGLEAAASGIRGFTRGMALNRRGRHARAQAVADAE